MNSPKFSVNRALPECKKEDMEGQHGQDLRASPGTLPSVQIDERPNQPQISLQGTHHFTSLEHLLLSRVSSSAPSVKKARLVHKYVWLDLFMQREQDDVLTFTNIGVQINKKLEREYFNCL